MPRKAYETMRLLPPADMNGKNEEKNGITPKAAPIFKRALAKRAIIQPLPITCPSWFFDFDEVINPAMIKPPTAAITAKTVIVPQVDVI